MHKFEEIFTRLYEKLGITKDSEFCKKYNYSASTVSSWKNRNSIPFEKILEITQNENLSLDYILNGVEPLSTKIDYKKALIENIDTLNANQVKYFYHLSEAEKLKS